jgi:hypothetical protein
MAFTVSAAPTREVLGAASPVLAFTVTGAGRQEALGTAGPSLQIGLAGSPFLQANGSATLPMAFSLAALAEGTVGWTSPGYSEAYSAKGYIVDGYVKAA